MRTKALFTTVTFRDAPIRCDTCDRAMSFRFKGPFAFVVGATASLFIACTLLLVLWLQDVQNDRKHTVSVNAATPVFAGNGSDGGCYGTRLTTVERGAELPVRRIRYLKDCAAIDVALPDGRKGYVVLGIGDVSVNPPLPTT
jgi:hypothetical protein